MRSKRVCVIGAGVAGLVTAKVMLADGFDVTVFDKHSEIGGVWSRSRTYPGLCTNNPRDTYAFSDHPFSQSADDFPSAEQVREYLWSYVQRFGLAPRIRLNATVLEARASGMRAGGSWRVKVQGDGRVEEREFDYLVVCNGVFSEPHIPDIEGADRFAGAIFHSSQLTGAAAGGARRVLIVGAGKSAHDCAVWTAEQGLSATVLFRRAHWMLPRRLLRLVNCQWLIYTRFSERTLPSYRRLDEQRRNRLSRFALLQWRVVGELLRRQFRMPSDLVPKTRLPDGIYLGGISTGSFYRLVRHGAIRTIKGSIARFLPGTTIELESGATIEADLVVFATGWRQRLPFLDEGLRARIQRDGRFFLYRMIVPIGIDNLGFVGYNSSTACQLTAEIAAHWLSDFFLGELCPPSGAIMENETAALHNWLDAVMPERNQGFFIGPYVGNYIDELMRDMGLNTRRTRSRVAENLFPMWPSRYAEVQQERQARRQRSMVRQADGCAITPG